MKCLGCRELYHHCAGAGVTSRRGPRRAPRRRQVEAEVETARSSEQVRKDNTGSNTTAAKSNFLHDSYTIYSITRSISYTMVVSLDQIPADD